jgi:hypothetical protein
MVNPSQVHNQSLWDVLGAGIDQEGADTYKLLEELVKTHLFSNFPERRPWALERMRHMFSSPYAKNLEIATVNDDGEVWAYIKFGEAPVYFLVGTYSEKLVLLEPNPSKTEREQWKQCVSR